MTKLTMGLILSGLASACAPSTLSAGRPGIELQGYVLAAAPAERSEELLGRRYDRAAGELGDEPCALPAARESASHQRLTAELSRRQLAELGANWRQLLDARVALERLEGVRVELTSSRRARASVPTGCHAPVIYEALAGTLHLEYRLRDQAELGATAALLEREGTGKLAVDTHRLIVSETLVTDQFVAFRVHQPDRSGIRAGALGLSSLALAGGAVVVDRGMARDGRDSAAEWIPVVMYATSAATALLAYVIWR